MSSSNKTRREQKKKLEKQRLERRNTRRLTQEAPSLLTIPEKELLELVPRAKIETLVGAAVTWRILLTRDEIRDFDLTTYNTAVYADMHYRLKHLPRDEHHPLDRAYDLFMSDTPDFAERINAPHNQVVITGLIGHAHCIKLSLASIYPNTLLLNSIELANPNIPASRPMDDEQRFAGLGNGVFVEIIERLKAFGKRHGFGAIRAYAVDQLRATIFQHKGFQLDTSDQRLLRTGQATGRQIPLTIPLP